MSVLFCYCKLTRIGHIATEIADVILIWLATDHVSNQQTRQMLRPATLTKKIKKKSPNTVLESAHHLQIDSLEIICRWWKVAVSKSSVGSFSLPSWKQLPANPSDFQFKRVISGIPPLEKFFPSGPRVVHFFPRIAFPFIGSPAQHPSEKAFN